MTKIFLTARAMFAQAMSAVLGAVAAIGMSVSAAADTEMSGFAGASVGYVNIDTGFDDGDGTAYGVEGAWAMPLMDRFGLQVDGAYQRLDGDGGDADVVTGAAHIFVRDSESYAVGGFVSVANVDDSTLLGIGAEGALYRGGLTYDAQIAYLQNDDSDADIMGASVGVTYFPLQDLSIGANVSVINIDTGGGDATGYGVGANVEWQLRDGPVSVYAEAGYTSIDDANVDVTSVMVGVRWTGGMDSLFDRDRFGASMFGVRRIIRGLPL